jgi:hypothetical protein
MDNLKKMFLLTYISLLTLITNVNNLVINIEMQAFFLKNVRHFRLDYKKNLPHLVQGNCEKGKYEENFKLFVHGDILK